MARRGTVLLLVVAAVLSALTLCGCGSPPSGGEEISNGVPNLLTCPPGKWVDLFDGRTLAGWETFGGEGDSYYGRVVVENGAIVLYPGTPSTAIRWAGAFPRDNYEVSLEANRLEGSDFFCGMTFPVGDSYCTLICGGWGGSVVGLSNVDEFAADNNETTRDIVFDNNRWYRIRLQVTKEAIRVWIDDEKVIDLARAGHRFSIWPQREPERPFGVASYNTKAALRNFKFRNL